MAINNIINRLNNKKCILKKNKCGKKNNKSINKIKKNQNNNKRQYISKKLRQEVWTSNIGLKYNSKCYIDWCTNDINVFNYHIGHNIPHSKGGSIKLSNLKPICSNCNLSMSNNYTINEWNDSIKNDLNNKKNYTLIKIIPTIISNIFYQFINY